MLSLATKCRLQESLDYKNARIEKAQGQGRKNGLISYSISIANKTTTKFNVEMSSKIVVDIFLQRHVVLHADQAREDITHAMTSGSPFLLSFERTP